MQVNIQYVSEHLEDLLASTQPGEEVEITRGGQTLAKLIVMPPPMAKSPGKRILGAGRGKLFLTDEQWCQVKEEDARLISDAPLMTTGEV